MWVILFLGCMTMLYQNAQSVLDKYHRNEKIVDIQLKFGAHPQNTLFFIFYFLQKEAPILSDNWSVPHNTLCMTYDTFASSRF